MKSLYHKVWLKCFYWNCSSAGKAVSDRAYLTEEWIHWGRFSCISLESRNASDKGIDAMPRVNPILHTRNSAGEPWRWHLSVSGIALLLCLAVSSLKPPCVTSLMRIHNQHRVEDRHMRHPELHSYNVAYPFCSIFHLLGNVAEVLAFSQKQGFSQKEKLDEELKKLH